MFHVKKKAYKALMISLEMENEEPTENRNLKGTFICGVL